MVDIKLNCWIAVEDGLIGTENQCIGVCEALGIAPEIKRIRLRQPWKTFSPYIPETAAAFNQAFIPPWPDLLISAGRKSVAASRYIKRMSGGKTFTVQLQDPKVSPAHFDMVAVPAHDCLRGENVIVTAATPNRITVERMTDAAQGSPTLSTLPSPRVAVLIGGDSKTHIMTPDRMREVTAQLAALPASLMITASRRTNAQCQEILRNALHRRDNIFLWDGTGDNPYLAMLGLADYIIVTSDSASMLSEACTTGKPVYMLPLEKRADKKRSRIDKLHRKLQDLQALRVFDGTLEQWTYEPLNDAVLVANEIIRRMNLK